MLASVPVEFGELTGALDDPTAALHHRYDRTQHEQERLAVVDSQPPARSQLDLGYVLTRLNEADGDSGPVFAQSPCG